MKNYVRTGITCTQGAFPDKVSPDIDSCTNKPVVQWDVQVVKNNFYR